MEETINLVNAALRNYFARRVGVGENEIGFQRPRKSWVDAPSPANPKIDLFLFDIRENRELRSGEWQRTEGREGYLRYRKPDVTIDLHYMVTCYGDESGEEKIVEQENRWIGRIVRTLHTEGKIPADCFLDETGRPMEGMPVVKISPEHPKFLETDGGFQLWSAVDQYIRPVVFLKATVPMRLEKYAEYARVREKILKFGMPERKDYHTFFVQPPVASLVCGEGGTCIVFRIEKGDPVAYLGESVPAGSQTMKIAAGTIQESGLFVVDDGERSETVDVIAVNPAPDGGVSLVTREPLRYAHAEGRGILHPDTANAERLERFLFVVEPKPGRSRLGAVGRDVEKMEKGDLIRIEKGGEAEYLFVTERFIETIDAKETIEHHYEGGDDA